MIASLTGVSRPSGLRVLLKIDVDVFKKMSDERFEKSDRKSDVR